jgi:hypothetical protein
LLHSSSSFLLLPVFPTFAACDCSSRGRDGSRKHTEFWPPHEILDDFRVRKARKAQQFPPPAGRACGRIRWRGAAAAESAVDYHQKSKLRYPDRHA